MPNASATDPGDPDSIAPLPGWITSGHGETPEDVPFLSGAALAHLHLVARAPNLPQALWRDRLALNAAETCAGFAGRREGQAALRDAAHLTRPGDHPGPAGVIFRQWSLMVARPIAGQHLGKALEGIEPERIAFCLDAAGTPVARAAMAIQAVLADAPRAETPALILADAVLSQALGWRHLLPLLALGLKHRDLRLRGDDLHLACHRALVRAAGLAVPLAAELTRRAAGLRAVAPKLRAKGAGRAVELFLSRDALASSALDFMSDRAARRLCDRLVEIGAIRELTGRETFRLYGV
ncbi:DUF1403 family protein [Tabrizicola oligotrophica]|uniref:DUF1403 family protein n=1 Tax=Tabrizicola oligotrophica TaxID=2710650 RepID=A0A6M0QYF9_9RHOB|nr:DUF1403 family protein [Tabrizicola oligotrophica]NEY92041.1 DUF1403 family protein [Tabrizicola oligotrophica]